MVELQIRENEPALLESAVKGEMDKAIRHFEKELLNIRTGRASVSMLDGIKAECYGQMMDLREIATLAAPEANLITIQPWDLSNIPAIEKAIYSSDLGLTPLNDGKLIRLQLPKMTTARRDELVKLLGKKTEDCRITIRNIRKEFHNLIRDAEKKGEISEDFAKRLSESLQKITDSYIEKANKLSEKKATSLRI